MVLKTQLTNHIILEERSDRHFILQDTPGGVKYFLKLLRANSAQRTKELIPEIFTERLLSRVDVSKLNPQIVYFREKPGILMRYFLDLRNPTHLNLIEMNIVDREYFAAALFLIDLVVKNTNRSKDRTDHVGWDDTGKRSYELCPLDNGNSMGHGDENLEDDTDLNNPERFKQHFSSLLIPALDTASVAKAIANIEALNLDEEGASVKKQLLEALSPTDEERQFITDQIQRIIVMLNRRRPLAIQAMNTLMAAAAAQNPQPLQPVAAMN